MGNKNSNDRYFSHGNKDAKNGGRPKLPPDLKGVKKVSKEIVEKTLSKLIMMSPEQLSEHLKDNKNPIFDHIIGRIALMAIKQGDPVRLSFLLERMVGKVEAPEKIIPLSLPPKTILRKKDTITE
jgi:hypothetical protein